ncbi:trimeric intracellular cation channel family protein [Amycolatopsis pigmentata]|uniref:Trimeric intracellular cation channel family protein n=1 Tax=Amycolatopsis pigmentata TaxID=450801 RepID=A0ABW5G152_9PSEU
MTDEPLQVLVPDLMGVFVFGLSGGLAGVRARLDLFGVTVLAGITALGGGVVRDLLLGLTPPFALRHWPYVAVAFVAGLVAFLMHAQVQRLRRAYLVLDAAGLGLFTVTATKLGLQQGLGLVGACTVGVITGIGGGVIRDVLIREIPIVLRSEIYALAALIGAVTVYACYRLHVLQAPEQIAAATLVFVVRLIALRRGWQAPVAR